MNERTYPPVPSGPQESRTDTDAIIESAHATGVPHEPPGLCEGAPVVVLPKGYTATPVPGWRKQPIRASGTVQCETLESLCRYVLEFKTLDSRVFVSMQKGVVTAVLDYHASDGTTGGWCEHRCTLVPIKSDAFERWEKVNGKPMSQSEFALFLENNLQHIFEPSGADLLGIINAFEVDGAMSFSKVQRLQDGSVKMAFSNETRAKSGDVNVPTKFAISVPMFLGDDAIPITARLRYRLGAGGDLKLWFELEELPEARMRAFNAMVARIAQVTEIVPFLAQV
jgi:uncharacterized protein YfdQ (DUF2303 family)